MRPIWLDCGNVGQTREGLMFLTTLGPRLQRSRLATQGRDAGAEACPGFRGPCSVPSAHSVLSTPPPTPHLSCPLKLQVCDKVRALSTTPAHCSRDLGTSAPKHFPLHGSDLGSLCGHREAGHLSLDTKGLWPCEVRRHLLELVKTHTGR